ncbi:hypothetical protein [Shewanella gelidii]|uniref:Uncharacterized protein n=1 Tax=Shewanella gelidii TaxID=1642821 RepID=A0A917JMX9_9GAMM|nr:hypothetical protein [Shewanella gelidii]MCL1097127.1 hypothetical protein [Shewanella gelidii]GGI72729.1 hypothetical protein GCM10009332_07730 [Shewanella gelidii]
MQKLFNESIGVIRFAREISESSWLNYSDEFEKALCKSTNTSLDFSSVRWGDTIPLLAISQLCYKEFINREKKLSLIINTNDLDHQVSTFNTFLSRHGFLDIFEKSCFFYDGNCHISIGNLKNQISRINVKLKFNKAECIPATQLTCHELTESDIAEQVNLMVDAAANEVATKIPSSHIYEKDYALQKLRTVLAELIENSCAYAYSRQDLAGCVSVFARVRFSYGVSDKRNEAQDQERNCILINKWERFRLGENGVWIELFVLDSGAGLLSNIDNWTTEWNDEAQLLEQIIKSSKYPLRSLMGNVFSGGYSSSRRNNEKTFITGLQLIYQTLSSRPSAIDGTGDFIRLITGNEVISGHLPLPKQHGIGGVYQAKKTPDGTYYHCGIGISPEKFSLPDYFHKPDEKMIDSIKKDFSGKPAIGLNNVKVVDIRHLKEEGNYTESAKRPSRNSIPDGLKHIVWLPSESVNKHDIKSWLELSLSKSIFSITIADIPIHRASYFDYLIINERFYGDLIGSGLNVYLITRDWRVVHYLPYKDKAKVVFKYSDNEKYKRMNLANLNKSLRETDSKIFWSKIGQAFLNESVLWEKRNGEDDIVIQGYIDFGRATSNRYIHKIIKASFERALPLWQYDDENFDFVTTDELVKSFASDLKLQTELRHYPSINDSSSRYKKNVVLVGSVKVTGETNTHIKTIAASQRTVNMMDEIYVLVHPSIPINKPYMRLLNWSEKFKPEVNPKYERIESTPFVKKGGIKSYNIISRSHSPAQLMYSEFAKGFMKLGHWDYSGSHDLLTVNLSRVVTLSHQSVSWVAAMLTELHDKDKANILVYISHAVTEKLFHILGDRFEHTLSKYQSFPLQRVNSGISQQSFFSPLVLEDIERCVETNCNASLGKKVNIVVVDDAIVSGKTLRDAEEVLKFNSKCEITSLVIVDRSGYPSSKGMNDYYESHRAYWRWDVPSMGSRAHCPMCSCLNTAKIFQQVILDSVLQKRIDEWIKMWSARKVVDQGWDVDVYEPIPLDPPRKMTFGRHYKEKSGVEFDHKYSTTLTAMSIEISRSTLRVDFPIQKFVYGNSLQDDICNSAKLEVICCHLLILGDAIPLTKQVEYYECLLDLLWNEITVSPSSSLAGITLFYAEDVVLPLIWERVKENISIRGCLNFDTMLASAYIANRLLETGFLSEKSFRVDDISSPQQVEAFTFLELVLTGKERGAKLSLELSEFFKVCGVGPSVSHEGLIDKILNPKGKKIDGCSFINQFKECMSTLSDVLAYLKEFKFIDRGQHDICFSNIKQLLEYSTSQKVYSATTIRKISDRLSASGLIPRMWDAIIIEAHKVEEFLYETVAKFDKAKSGIIDSKINSGRMHEKWHDTHMPEVYISELQIDPDSAPRFMFLSPTRELIYDRICNSIYAKDGITDEMGQPCTQIIRAQITKDNLRIELINKVKFGKKFELLAKPYEVLHDVMGGQRSPSFTSDEYSYIIDIPPVNNHFG